MLQRRSSENCQNTNLQRDTVLLPPHDVVMLSVGYGTHRVQKSDAGVGIGTLVGANAPTPPYGGGLAPPTPPIMVGASAPTPPLSRPVGLPNG